MEESLIDRVVRVTGLNQRELAKRLGVSAAQITRWKTEADTIPLRRQEELAELAGLFLPMNPEWSIFAKNELGNDAWAGFLRECLNCCEAGSQLSYKIEDEPALFVPSAILFLKNDLKIQVPETAPALSSFETEELPAFHSIVIEFLENWAIIDEWIWTYLKTDRIQEVAFDEVGDLDYHHSRFIASLWIEDTRLEWAGLPTANAEQFKHQARIETYECLARLCRELQGKSIPFEIDYFDLVNLHPETLDDRIFLHKHLGVPKTVEALLPYSEQQILNLLSGIQETLKQIENRLELLEKGGTRSAKSDLDL